MKIYRGIGADTVNIALANGDSGQYRIEFKNSDSGKTRFVCHCYGFTNSVIVATGIAKEQCEYVTHSGFKPENDQSQYP